MLLAAAEVSDRQPDATDVILISDCMPTKGIKTYAGLARLAARVPSLYIAFADDRGAAIQMFGGERQLDLYQWWAQQWVGADRLKEFADLDDVEGVVDLLSRRTEWRRSGVSKIPITLDVNGVPYELLADPAGRWPTCCATTSG